MFNSFLNQEHQIEPILSYPKSLTDNCRSISENNYYQYMGHASSKQTNKQNKKTQKKQDHMTSEYLDCLLVILVAIWHKINLSF